MRHHIPASVFLASSAPGKSCDSDSAVLNSAAASFVFPFFDSTIPWWYRTTAFFSSFLDASEING